jgi:hypothetical protein
VVVLKIRRELVTAPEERGREKRVGKRKGEIEELDARRMRRDRVDNSSTEQSTRTREAH